VGGEPRLGAGLAADHFEDLLDPFRGKRVAVDREKETVFPARLRADVVNIVMDGESGPRADIGVSLLVPLAEHPDPASGEIDVLDQKVSEFRKAYPGVNQELDDGTVAGQVANEVDDCA